MRTRLAIASSVALGLLACGDVDERVADAEPGAYDAHEPSPPGGDLAEPGPDVAAAPWGGGVSPAPAASDAEIARKIREALVAGDESLSSRAQNVDVTAEQGVVRLRGSVENEREKEIVLSIARATPGVAGVEDQLEIAER